MTTDEAIKSTRTLKPEVIKLLEKLFQNNKHDYYWKELLELSKADDFFEPCLLQYYIGKTYKPAKILEIGTRTGGSLIALLASYDSYKNVEVYSFDLWKENIQATWFSKIPVVRSIIKSSFINLYLSLKVIKENLALFSIPSQIITFISGDSKQTVPEFFKNNKELLFDYILVDGAHDPDTAYIDLENIGNHLAKNGFILFDDINPSEYNLLGVWEKFKNNHSNEFDFYETMHRKGIGWAIKK
jgi:predicted O-methyltransferase YrrM